MRGLKPGTMELASFSSSVRLRPDEGCIRASTIKSRQQFQATAKWCPSPALSGLKTTGLLTCQTQTSR